MYNSASIRPTFVLHAAVFDGQHQIALEICNEAKSMLLTLLMLLIFTFTFAYATHFCTRNPFVHNDFSGDDQESARSTP